MATVTYNGYALPNVYGAFQYNENEVQISFSCNFLVTADSESALVTACQAAEKKLTEKNKDLTVVFGGTTELSFSHSGSTGFSSRPHLTKNAGVLATGTSRDYNFSVAIQLPFTQSGYDCRREAGFNVDYLPTRQKQVSFQMLYTCSTSATAIANYTTYGKAWATTILTTIGGNFELISEHLQEEQERKIINASLVYKEILTNQSTSGVDDTSIVNPTVNYSCSIEQQTGKGITSNLVSDPLVRIHLTYSTALDKTVVGSDLNTAYYQRVRPYLIQNAYTVLGLSSYKSSGRNYIVESENKNIDNYNYHISGSLSFIALKSLTTILQLTESVSITDNPNIVFKKLWNGQDYTFNMYSVGKIMMLQRTVTIAQFSKMPTIPVPLTTQLAPIDCTWKKVFPTVSQYRLDVWGVGSEGTSNLLKKIEIYFATFSEQYLAVRAATMMGGASANILG